MAKLYISPSVGTNSFITETPSGAINGSNTSFTVANTYVSMVLTRDGQILEPGGADYTLSGTTITFVTAPVTGSVLRVFGVTASSVSGNADTVDGYHANATPTANTIPVLDAQAGLPAAAYNGGWIYSTDTLNYASASSVTITGVDRTSVYTKGTKVKFTNNSTTYYGTVSSSTFSTNTTINFFANNDYSIANSAITNPFYSYGSNPQGYPTIFNYTPTFTTSGSAFTNAPTASLACFWVIGSVIYLEIVYSYNATSGGTGGTDITVPVAGTTSATITASRWTDGASGAANFTDTTHIRVFKYDTTTMISNSATVGVSGFYKF